MEKTLEYIKETLEEELKTFKKKGDIKPEDVKVIKDALCAIKEINEMNGSGTYSEGTMRMNHMPYGTEGNTGYSGTNRSPVTGRYVSYGTYPQYNYGVHGYSGHSINDRMVAALEPMYDMASSEHEKQVISNWINRIRSEQ